MKNIFAALKTTPSRLVVRPSNDPTGIWYAELNNLDGELIVEGCGYSPKEAIEALETVLA